MKFRITYIIFPLLLFFLGCQKKLVEKSNQYDEWYNGNELPELKIPCENNLVSNYYEANIPVNGTSSFYVSNIQTSTSSGYEIMARTMNTATHLDMSVWGAPKTFLGRRMYLIKNVNFRFVDQGINSATFYPVLYDTTYLTITDPDLNTSYVDTVVTLRNDTLYVDYYDDSMAFNFCSIEMSSLSFDKNIFITGKIVSKF